MERKTVEVMKTKLSEKTSEGIKCLLCPHFCIIKKWKSGKCKVRENIGNNDIHLKSYGRLTTIAVEPIEKKPLFHFSKGSKTLSLGLWGCNLKCQFCENFEYSQKDRSKDKEIELYFLDYIVSLAKEKECQSVCMTYTEPTIHFEYLMDLANECHQNDLKFILNTNAYINQYPWFEICKNTDAMNIDWKGFGKKCKKITGVENKYIYDRLSEAYKLDVHVEISIPLYHDILKEEAEIHRFAQTVNLIDPNIPCHLLKVYPAYKQEKYHSTSNKVVEKVKNILSEHLYCIYS